MPPTPIPRTAECVKLNDLQSLTNRIKLPQSEQGGMSVVETATYSGRKVVLKTLRSDAPPYDIKQFRAEIDALQSVRSDEEADSVVELIAYCESPLALVLEWCEGGNLLSFITNNPNLSWTIKLELLIDLGFGLTALHKRHWESQKSSKFESFVVVLPPYPVYL